MDVRVVTSVEALGELVPEWDALARCALEPNPFYESWFLLPAWRELGSGRDIRVLLFYNGNQLRGLVPLERLSRFNSLPLHAWSVWKHPYCFLSMPLLHRDSAAECLTAFFDWVAADGQPCDAVEWRFLPGDGPFHQLLADELHRRNVNTFLWEWFTRALFKPAGDPEAYLTAALSGKHRKALRRRAELMREVGPLGFTVPDEASNIQESIDTFLRLESSGWKGQEGSALACHEHTKRFFQSLATEAHRRGALLLPAVTIGDRTVAQNCYFQAGRAVFHFKTSFDEEYSRFSPGFHLECEMTRYLHTRPGVEWMDSCTAADNEMFNRLYLHRRTIQSVIVPVARGVRRFLVSSMPLLRMLKQSARPSSNRGAGVQAAAAGNGASLVH